MMQLRKLGGVCGVVLVLLLAGSEVRAAGGTAYVVRWTQPNQCSMASIPPALMPPATALWRSRR